MLSIGSAATYAQNAMYVYMNDGHTLCFRLSQDPVATIEGTDVVVRSVAETVTIPMADIGQFAVEDVHISTQIAPTAIHDTDAVLYNAEGKMMRRVRINGNNYDVLVKDMPEGLYLLKVKNTVIKITKQ